MFGSRKNLNGTSGARLRSSVTTNAASSASETAKSTIVWVEPQPALLASTIA